MLGAAAAGLPAPARLFPRLGPGPGLGPLPAGGWPLIAARSLATGVGYAFFLRLQRVVDVRARVHRDVRPPGDDLPGPGGRARDVLLPA